MRSMKLRCPNPTCHVVLAVPAEMEGRQVRCAGCGEQFIVPPTAGAEAGKSRRKPRQADGDDSVSSAA